MYKYKNLCFTPIEESDLEMIRNHRNDSDTLLYLGQVDLINPIQQKEWFHKISSSKNQIWCKVLELTSMIPIGIIRIQQIDHLNKNCEIGADVLKEYRNKGYGKLIYEMVLDYLFNHFNMHMVYLKVAEFNSIGIKLYKKVGFIETGRIPESIFRFGKYWDTIIMYINRENYLKTLNK